MADGDSGGAIPLPRTFSDGYGMISATIPTVACSCRIQVTKVSTVATVGISTDAQQPPASSALSSRLVDAVVVVVVLPAAAAAAAVLVVGVVAAAVVVSS